MSKIRSIADEIRERIKSESEILPVAAEPAVVAEVSVQRPPSRKKQVEEPAQAEIHAFFEQLSAFRMEGKQKIVIRLDADSMKLLKQLKFTRDIDMTKVIVFAFSRFLAQHPWLKGHVRELLKKHNYEMD